MLDLAEQEVFSRQVISFTVFGDAKAAGSKRGFKSKGGRIIIVDANKNSKPWKQEVAGVAAETMASLGLSLLTGPLEVTFRFFRPRPAGHFGKRGLLPSARPHPSTAPDLLKTARGCEDAMTGIVWKDDALIVDEHLSKRYGEPARVEITVSLAEPLTDTKTP